MLIQFTEEAGARIGGAVRLIEQIAVKTKPLSFPTLVDGARPSHLKLATFTGDWPINTFKTVKLYGVTSTPNTASVLNLCTPAVGFKTALTAETRFVIFGKVKYTTDPVVVELQAAPTNTACVLTLGGVDLSTIAGYSSTNIQLLGHNTTGPCLEWYSISTCGTATSTP